MVCKDEARRTVLKALQLKERKLKIPQLESLDLWAGHLASLLRSKI